MGNHDLIESLKRKNILTSFALEQAFREIDRADFVIPENKFQPYIDSALSIGYGQTISQPLTVAFMLEHLQIEEGNKILDIGTGSGWIASLMAYMVGDGGHIHTMEIISQLVNFAKENIDKFPLIKDRITFHNENAKDGLPEISKSYGGFDRIIASAELNSVPSTWTDQLKIGGIMIYPKDNGIYKVVRNSTTDTDSLFYPGFAFVPFRED